MSKIQDLYAEVNDIDDLKTTSEQSEEIKKYAYEIKKETLCNELQMLVDDTPYRIYKEVITKAINFIKTGEL